MRGFLVGSLALIVYYVALQPGTAAKAATGGGALISLARRALSPDVAGVPDHSQPKGIAHVLPWAQGGAGGRAKAN